MPNKVTGHDELHEATRGGEHIMIRRARPEDKALYQIFCDVNPQDLRLRFFAYIGELSAEEAEKLAHLDNKHERVFVELDESAGSNARSDAVQVSLTNKPSSLRSWCVRGLKATNWVGC